MELFLKVNTFVTAIMCLSMAMLLFTLKFPDNAALNSYKTSRRVMALVYLALAITNTAHLTYLISDGEVVSNEFDYAVTAGIYIIISSWQALLITYSLVVLIDAYFVTRKRIMKQIIPGLFLSTLVVCGFFSENILFLKTTITIFSVYYVFQLFFYTRLFFHKERKFTEDADNFFSDDEVRRIRWIRIAFLSALSIGVWAFAIVLFPEIALLERLFSLASILFYMYFGLQYLNYMPTFQVLMPVIAPEKEDESTAVYAGENELAHKLECWIDRKAFARSGITISGLAEELNTNRTYLSGYIKMRENTSFNRWLNGLRIEEAKSLMMSNPELTMSELTDRAGFTEQSSFSKQFAGIEGCSPSLWRKENACATLKREVNGTI